MFWLQYLQNSVAKFLSQVEPSMYDVANQTGLHTKRYRNWVINSTVAIYDTSEATEQRQR